MTEAPRVGGELLVGRVLGEGDAPVAAAEVELLDSEGLRVLVGRSDASGGFQLAIASDSAPATIRVTSPAYEPHAERVRPLRQGQEDEEVVIRLRRVRRLAGIVTDARSVPIPGIVVRLVSGHPRGRPSADPTFGGDAVGTQWGTEATTLVDGSFDLGSIPPGRYFLSAGDDALSVLWSGLPGGGKGVWHGERRVPYPKMEREHLIVGICDYFALSVVASGTRTPVVGAQAAHWSPGVSMTDAPLSLVSESGGSGRSILFGRVNPLAQRLLVAVSAPGFESRRVLPVARPWPTDGAFILEEVMLVPDASTIEVPVPVAVVGPPRGLPDLLSVELRFLELPSPATNNETPIVDRMTRTVHLRNGTGEFRLKPGAYAVRPTQAQSIFEPVHRLEIHPDGSTLLELRIHRHGQPVIIQSACAEQARPPSIHELLFTNDATGAQTLVVSSRGTAEFLLLLNPGTYEVRGLVDPGYSANPASVTARDVGGASFERVLLRTARIP